MSNSTLNHSIGNSGEGKRRRKKSIARSLQNRARDSASRLWNRLDRLSHSRLLTAVPLVSYLFLGATFSLAFVQLVTDVDSYPLYWIPGAEPEENEKLQAELFEQKFQIVSYLLTLFLMMFRIGRFKSFMLKEKTLLMVLFAIALTAFSTVYADRVVINLIHLIFGILAIWLYLDEPHRKSRLVEKCCSIVAYSVLLTLAGSTLLFFLHSSSSLQAIVDGQRFGGLAGNPNSLGGLCMVAAWGVLGRMALTPFRSRKFLALCVAALLVFFNVWLTGSATALAITSFVATLLVGNVYYRRLGKKGKAALIFSGAVAFFSALMFIAVQQNLLQYAQTTTDALGKDLTLSGRTDLWFIGWHAFMERPVLGWGYDNHQYLFENPLYSVPYNHYHNGFISSLAAGGLVFGLAILFNYIAFFKRYIAIGDRLPGKFVLLVAIATASLQNMTEYSMFRNNTTIWVMYLVAFMALAIMTVHVQRRAKKTGKTRRKSGIRF